MNIIDFIEKIQNKPRVVRVRILWAFVLVCSFFVVSFWVASLKYSVKEVSQTKEKIIKETPSLMEALKASVGALFEDNIVEEEIEIGDSPQNTKTAKPMRLPVSK